jgi:hypothetical protein
MASIRPTRKATTKGKHDKGTNRMVSFHWEGLQYTIDLQRQKVYQNWMAVETNKGCAIMGAYRSSVTV